ncbi:unnamed protein product [Symbiodinium sp. KB8]|nr:unnamed protein product [Symbiodinium sp. KB8]
MAASIEASTGQGGSGPATDEYVAPTVLDVPVMTEEEVAAMSCSAAEEGWEERVRELMDEFGVVVLTDVLNGTELEQAEAAFGRDLKRCIDTEALSSLPGDFQTWAKEFVALPDGELPRAMPWRSVPGKPGQGMASLQSMAHGEFAWSLRQKHIVKAAFAALHAVDSGEMASSTDVPFFLPPSAPLPSEGVTQWLHMDYNSHIPGTGDRPCFQGVLYVWSAEAGDASTTVVMPRSHADGTFEELMRDDAFRTEPHHSCKLYNASDPARRRALVTRALERSRRVPAPAGSLVLWDSRVAHQGWRGSARLAQTVMWEARDHRGDTAWCRKAAAAAIGMATTHFACIGRWHPACRPRKPRAPQFEAGNTDSIILPMQDPTPWSLDVAPVAEEKWPAFVKAANRAERLADRVDKLAKTSDAERKGQVSKALQVDCERFAALWQDATGEAVDPTTLTPRWVGDAFAQFLKPQVKESL